MTEPREGRRSYDDEDDLGPEERRLAERIRDLPDLEPPEGWEERLIARWRLSRR